MAFLEQFSEADRQLMVRLPYRAGLWVSASDSTGDQQADAQEHKALADIIERRARGMFKSAFVHEVLAETYGQKEHWREWGDMLDQVPAECSRVGALLEDKLLPHDMAGYQQTIMIIARDVARAFREFDQNSSAAERFMTTLRIQIDKLIGAVRGEQYESESLLNISVQEDLALGTLSEALKVKK